MTTFRKLAAWVLSLLCNLFILMGMYELSKDANSGDVTAFLMMVGLVGGVIISFVIFSAFRDETGVTYDSQSYISSYVTLSGYTVTEDKLQYTVTIDQAYYADLVKAGLRSEQLVSDIRVVRLEKSKLVEQCRLLVDQRNELSAELYKLRPDPVAKQPKDLTKTDFDLYDDADSLA